MNRLQETSHDLVPNDYSDLFQRISAELERQGLFHRTDERTLLLAADKIARAVCEGQGLRDPLRSRGSEASSATVYLSDEGNFAQGISTLYEQVGQQLDRVTDGQPDQVIKDMVRSLASWTGKPQKVGLRYSFTAQTDLAKQRLVLEPPQGTRPILRFHEMTIVVENARSFEEQTLQSLGNVADEWAAGSAWQRDNLEEILEATAREVGSDLRRLRRVVDQESLGRLKREATVIYLEYLVAHLPKRQNNEITEEEGLWLADIADRLRLTERYLEDTNRAEGDFLLAYSGCDPVDLRDQMARGDAYWELPIIGQISGTLGELTDPESGTRRFHLGLKLKLGGRVMKDPDQPTSFEYHLARLNPVDAIHQRELLQDKGEIFRQRAIKRAFLYFVTLYKLGDFNFNPVDAFNQEYLPRLASTDTAAQREALHEIASLLEADGVQAKIDRLRTWLRKRLKEERRRFPDEERTRYLSVQRGLLVSGADEAVRERSFFKNVFQYDGRTALKYLVLSDDPVDEASLASLAISFQIENIHFYGQGEREEFAMHYDVADVRTLPVLLAPRGLPKEQADRLKGQLEQPGGILLPYTPGLLGELEAPDARGRKSDGRKAFAYRFTVTLLGYLGLLRILEHAPEDVFVPILRLHIRERDEKNPEDIFLDALSKILTHLLGEGKRRASTQGFDMSNVTQMGARVPTYVVQNALASLYADLPKRFTVAGAMQLDRLAIVIVSSRVSDKPRRGAGKLATLIGEAISLKREGNQVRVERLETFADTYDDATLYREPAVLVDLFGRLHKQGFRHVLYLARAPFTSTLNLTGGVQELYFMSPELLVQLVRPWPDLKLYPIFFDKYAVMKLPAYQEQAQSLYVDDTRQLQRLVRDESLTRQAVVFYNLFNGRDFGRGSSDHGFYNWVISYATLLNMHEGVLEDQHLREGLLYDGVRKQDILTFLTLFHFARYEAATGGKSGITLKLDPYENIIGDESIGALAEWPHAMGGALWNALAFLVAVRKVVTAPQFRPIVY